MDYYKELKALLKCGAEVYISREGLWVLKWWGATGVSFEDEGKSLEAVLRRWKKFEKQEFGSEED